MPAVYWRRRAAPSMPASGASSTSCVRPCASGSAARTSMALTTEPSEAAPTLALFNPRPLVGRVVRAVGTTVEAVLGEARIGELCQLRDPDTQQTMFAEVIGISDSRALLAPLGGLTGLST